jgi:hypothetical protein
MPLSPNDLWELRRRHDAGELPSLKRTAPSSTAKESA